MRRPPRQQRKASQRSYVSYQMVSRSPQSIVDSCLNRILRCALIDCSFQCTVNGYNLSSGEKRCALALAGYILLVMMRLARSDSQQYWGRAET
jgi:hypothetical protein